MSYNNNIDKFKIKPNLLALSPLLVFLSLYLVTSIIVNDFYKVPISVAFLISSIYAIFITKGLSINERIAQFSYGASNKNIMLMIWIFILAGAFAQCAKDIGAIDSTVNMTLKYLPGNMLLAGIFIASCFISLSIGTSVGTIVALVPVVAALSSKTGIDMAFMIAIVVGGSFFGDNLSFISDTTIAATRTQGCSMRDKFRVNFMIALPAAFLVLIYYIYSGVDLYSITEVGNIEWFKIIPYVVVLISAIAGVNVTIVLLLGILSTAVIGISYGNYSLFDFLNSVGNGVAGMGDLIIITLLAGGMLELIRFNGGIEYIINLLTRHIKGKRGAEFSIASLVSLANICTANNTIAIISVGPIAKDIAKKYNVDARKCASILDTFSCVIQGLIPYGAQILIASKLASLSPMNIIEYLYYPIGIGIFAILSIVFRYPKKYS